LWKPRTSAGGLRIVQSERATVNLESGYWQEYIAGEQIGVGCLIGQSKCRILGATSSFDANDWPGPLDFIYRGSFGPIALSAECRSQIEWFCTQIRDRIGYFGWLQFDFIRDQHGGLWLLECNPRWTAGMEIYLLAGGVNPVRELLVSYNFNNVTGSADLDSGFDCFAKAIVYATQQVNLSSELILELNRMEGLADRPHAPQWIEAGHPIATVRAGLKCGDASQAEAENRVRLLDELRERADRVKNLIVGG
jgi:predicted ATP-grasp superfamily ATP-dependent carboligase